MKGKEMLNKLKGKYVFLDLDGTLSEYRFNNHISGNNGFAGQTWEELFFGDVFVNNRPLETMIKLIKNLEYENVFILGAITTSHEMNEKYEWLDKYYPFIKKDNIIFVSKSEYKLIAIEQYAKKLKINKKDIVFIDDKHSTLRQIEEAGFTAYHVTSFIE